LFYPEKAKKASDGLAEALDKLQKQNKEINNIKTVGEKGLGELNESVKELTGSSEDHDAKIKQIQSSIDSSSSMIEALSNDIDKVKKRHAELAKQNTAA
jgi:chromosome segregation ATPase